MQNQAVILVLTILMNTANALIGFAAFKQGSLGFIICAVAGAAISNTLALFGRPAVASAAAEATKTITGASLRVLLPLAFGALLVSGCATAGGKALGACELGQLGSEGQIGLATAQQIASNPTSTSADLESAALQLLPGQLECGAKALLAWLESLGQPATASTIKGKLSASAIVSPSGHAIQVLQQFLAAHPSACVARTAL